MVILSIEEAAERAPLGDPIILARIPEAFRVWVSIDQLEDRVGEPLALAQIGGGEVRDTPANLAP